jgi:hypothetical protein
VRVRVRAKVRAKGSRAALVARVDRGQREATSRAAKAAGPVPWARETAWVTARGGREAEAGRMERAMAKATAEARGVEGARAMPRASGTWTEGWPPMRPPNRLPMGTKAAMGEAVVGGTAHHGTRAVIHAVIHAVTHAVTHAETTPGVIHAAETTGAVMLAVTREMIHAETTPGVIRAGIPFGVIHAETALGVIHTGITPGVIHAETTPGATPRGGTGSAGRLWGVVARSGMEW